MEASVSVQASSSENQLIEVLIHFAEYNETALLTLRCLIYAWYCMVETYLHTMAYSSKVPSIVGTA